MEKGLISSNIWGHPRKQFTAEGKKSEQEPTEPTNPFIVSLIFDERLLCLPSRFLRRSKNHLEETEESSQTQKSSHVPPKIVGKKQYDFWRKLLWLKKRN